MALIILIPFSCVLGSEENGKREVCAAVLEDFPPLYQVNSQGMPEGFAIDLFEEISRRENFEISYKVVKNWAEAMELIRTGEADVIPGIGKSETRQAEFVFTDKMESIPVSCFIKYGNKEITGIESLSKPGTVTGVIVRSAAQTKLESMGGIDLKLFDSIDPALNQLLSGEIDAFVFPEHVLRYKLYCMTISEKVVIVGEHLMFLNRGYLLAKEDTELLAIFNQALDSIMEDPFYAELYSKWYGEEKKNEIPGWIIPLISMLLMLTVIVIAFNIALRHQVQRRTEEIVASHKYVDNLLDATECTIIMLNEDLTIKYSNPYACHVFGYSLNEMAGKNAIDLLVPEKDTNGSDVQKYLSERMQLDDAVISNINQNITKDGKLLWMVWTNNKVNNLMTGEKEIISVGIDITSQKEAEEKLRQAQQELEVILDNMAGGMLYLDTDLKIVRVNKELERITNSTQDQLIGQKCYSVICNKEEPCQECSALKAIDSGTRSRNENFVLLNGRNYDVTTTPLKDTHDNILGTITILNDVTRRRNLENNLKNAHEALEKYTKALENKVEAGNVKLEKREEDLKAAQSQLIRAEKMASLGRLIAGIGHEINSPLGAIKSSGEIIHNSLDEIPKYFDFLASWLSGDHKEIFYEMLDCATKNTTIDVSSRERRIRRKSVIDQLESMGVENAFELAQRLIDMGLYEDIDQYEEIFRHPEADQRMRIIQNLSQVNKSTNIIGMAVERAHSIVYALKNYIHSSSSAEMAPVNLRDNISMVLLLYHNQIKYGVEVELELNDLPDIIGFADELNQIWSNLINNALQAMDYQGTLTIKGRSEADNIVLYFKDTGCGIPDEIKETIFEPLFTTKSAGEGTGIGLDIVSKIVKKHNGVISIESQPGEGAIFIVSLPINQETAEPGGAV